MKKTFRDYYNDKLKDLAKYAKRDKISVKDFIKKNYNRTLSEYRKWQKGFYESKDCRSFWHRECVNKGIECENCCHFYSISEWDKMSTKEQNKLKNS
jgi:hypothetical protein